MFLFIFQGGGFRDSLAEIADELCPPSADMKECLSLFVKTPNQRVSFSRGIYQLATLKPFR